MIIRKVLYLVNYADYFFSHRLSLAKGARAAGWETSVAVPAVIEEFHDRFTKEALPYHELSKRSKLYQWPQQIFVLFRTIGLHRPDLVHIITLRCTLFWALLAPLFPRQKTLHTIAGFGQLNGKAWHIRLIRWAVEVVLSSLSRWTSAHFIVQNSADADYLLYRNIVPAGRLHLIEGSGVDTDLFQPHIRDKDKRDVLHVGMAARRLRAKGFDAFIAVARFAKAKNLPVRFFIAHMPVTENHPDAIPEREWQSWLEEGLFEDKGHVLDMTEFYRDLDVFLYLSCYGEGLAKTLLEAAASGLPVITTPQPGCREAVEEGKSGYLLPSQDVQRICDRLMNLHSDPALRRVLGEVGRSRIEALYADRLITAQTLALYDKVVAS